MKPVERLRDMLNDALRPLGWCMADIDRITPVSGYWKSQDVMRWEALASSLTRPSDRISIGSWNTVADCLRYGIEVDLERHREAAIMVYAKEPKSSTKAA